MHGTTLRRDAATVLLAITSGATDAAGFVVLGGVFTSVMTGNMVIVGLSVGRWRLTSAALALVAIGGFVAGAALGARIAKRHRAAGDVVWPPVVTRLLQGELVVLVAAAVFWWSGAGSGPSLTDRYVLLVAFAVSLGLQSSAVHAFGVSGLSTTYLTGTLVTAVVRIAGGHGVRGERRSGAILLGLIGGAAAGAALSEWAWPLLPVLQVVGVGTAVLLGRRSRARAVTPPAVAVRS